MVLVSNSERFFVLRYIFPLCKRKRWLGTHSRYWWSIGANGSVTTIPRCSAPSARTFCIYESESWIDEYQRERRKRNLLIKENTSVHWRAERNWFAKRRRSWLFNGKADVIVCDGFCNVILEANPGRCTMIRKKEESKDPYLVGSNYKDYGGTPVLSERQRDHRSRYQQAENSQNMIVLSGCWSRNYLPRFSSKSRFLNICTVRTHGDCTLQTVWDLIG